MKKDVTFPERVKVNTTDLQLAIREGRNPMESFFDPDHDNLPYFSHVASGPDPGVSHSASYSMAQVPGRWLNALLNAEDALGIEVDENVVDDLAKWTYKAFEGAMGLSQTLDLETFEPVAASDLHNLRETTHALYALVKYRDDQKALEIAKRQIETINRFYDYQTGVWNEEAFKRETGGETNCGAPFPRHFGRYIGPLVKLYKACGMEESLIQAIRLKDFAFKNVLNEEGNYDVGLFGVHTHSTTSMISSLAQLGELLGDHTILARVKSFMENGLGQIALPFGWCLEKDHRDDHVGEINNSGDIMEACLILGKSGYSEYYQQAERILRSHILPSQLLDTSFLPDHDLPEDTGHHKLATRSKGAFGFPCPYGHEYGADLPISFNLDIVGGGVASLCEAYRAKVTVDGSLISVNLHFDHEGKDVRIKSPYTNDDVMEIELKRKYLLRVRLSDWVEREELAITVNGERKEGVFSGDWLYLSGLDKNSTVKIKIPMKTATSDYKFRSDTFAFRWRGDAVEGAKNLNPRLCFFKGI